MPGGAHSPAGGTATGAQQGTPPDGGFVVARGVRKSYRTGERAVDAKVRMVSAYASQRRNGRPYFDADLVRGLARVRGAQIRAPWAEAFAVAARAGGMAPPAPDGVDRAVLRELVRRGHLVEREGIYFHRDAIDEAALVAARLLAGDPAGFTVATFRDVTGLTRKHVLPLLGELDARGITRRREDLRIAGPRLPQVPG